MISSRLVPRISAAVAIAATCTVAACSSKGDTAADSALAAAATDTFPSQEGMIDVPGGKVWYRKIGNGPGVPLLAMHGGPGGTSCRFEVLAPLANERPVIFYDQLGSGRSEHPTDTSLWNFPRFVQEVEAVRRALKLDSVHLLGHSWGGALAAEYMIVAKPSGVKSVVFSSPLISTPRWIADADSLREQLPESIQKVLDDNEKAGTLDSPAYKAATDSFYARHVRRLPTPTIARCEGVTSNDTIYRQMWGPTEFLANGSLKSWTRSADMDEITTPSLFIAGEFDEARPTTLEEFRKTMPDARLVVIPGGAHAAMREKPAEYIAAVRAFLAEVEKKAP
ncbi:proline iminopeptidase-family hydrolase [Gemmatimonas groenlandica]|uniref:Proline iminopeptidase-family hydrolase n=1 Tax=Gemmatimonas groenlandica TaxID=2732249 RepID=A0A6M4IUK5_9BACT|nr:proline iminopeptidase-family hydrolase [Gemmatimonas groenlandica]QJR35831.1 proline iminopeptidase-family hydrolase [Gemmatimonas groenlandica]